MPDSTTLPASVIESGLLNAIVTANGHSREFVQQVRSSGLTPADFAVYPEIYNFILEHNDHYGSVPTPDQIAAMELDWHPPSGQFRYWLDMITTQAMKARARQAMVAAADKLDTNPLEAIQQLMQQLATAIPQRYNHIKATDTTADTRFERFQKRKDRFMETDGQHIWGIPTGIHALDSSHEGWQPGELAGFYARPQVGKTWLLLREGVEAWRHGHRVLLISPEMPSGQIELRIDVLLAHALGYQLSHKLIKVGNPDIEAEYKKFSEAVKLSERWWTVDSLDGQAVSLTDLRQLIRSFQPHLVLVDGVALLRHEGKGQTWEKMIDLCYGLKNLATAASVSIITSHQATRKRQNGADSFVGRTSDDFKMPSLNDAAFGDAFVQACSTVLTMVPDKDNGNIRWFSIRKNRERETEHVGRMALGWFIDRGEIRDLSHLVDDHEAIKEALRGRADGKAFETGTSTDAEEEAGCADLPGLS